MTRWEDCDLSCVGEQVYGYDDIPDSSKEEAFDWCEPVDESAKRQIWWSALELMRDCDFQAKQAIEVAASDFHLAGWYREQNRRETQCQEEMDAERERKQHETCELAALVKSSLGIDLRPTFGGSQYGEFHELTIRVSDHPQNGTGGFNEGTGERYDAADVSFDIDREWTRETIRKAAADALRENR
jgi:hypothetical protein